MATVDAAGLTTRELNARLKELAGSGEGEIIIQNPQARHNIAVGVFDNCKIKINGSVGYYSASLLDGPEVAIDGNAGWTLGHRWAPPCGVASWSWEAMLARGQAYR